MYSRFLLEGAKITRNSALAKAAKEFDRSGRLFSTIGLMFKDAQRMKNVEEKIPAAAREFREIADIEEEAYRFLAKSI
jgi:hypothetical protein